MTVLADNKDREEEAREIEQESQHSIEELESVFYNTLHYSMECI